MRSRISRTIASFLGNKSSASRVRHHCTHWFPPGTYRTFGCLLAIGNRSGLQSLACIITTESLMTAFQIKVNGQTHSVDVLPDTPLLWVLRDAIGLDRHQVRLRRGHVRCLHRISRRQAITLMRLPRGLAAARARSPLSRGCPAERRPPCSGPGRAATFRNAATASPAR